MGASVAIYALYLKVLTKRNLVARTLTSTFGPRAFSTSGPAAWNTLSSELYVTRSSHLTVLGIH